MTSAPPNAESIKDVYGKARGYKVSRRILGVIAVGVLILIAGVWSGIEYWKTRQRMDLFDRTIVSVSMDPEFKHVRRKLGMPIQGEFGGMNVLDMESTQVGEDVLVSFNVEGTNCSARMSARLEPIHGVWAVKRIAAECDDGFRIEVGEPVSD